MRSACTAAKSFLPRDVVIVGMSRTPVGSFTGKLSSMTAPQLGAHAASNAIKRSRLEPEDIEEVVCGHVLAAACGQSPARQVALAAKIPSSVDVFSVNKVCSSGLKAVCLAADSIAMGRCDTAVAVGMESMSNAPFMLSKARSGGYKYGHGELLDSLLLDGLWDPYNKIHMGRCAEKVVRDYRISRVDQDAYAVESYKRASDAWKSGVMEKEVTAVYIPTEAKKSSPEPPFVAVDIDEEYPKLKLDRVASLKPSFEKEGTITAANASSINDGAAAVVLMSAEKAKRMEITPLARIVSYADAAVDPIDFAVAPSQAVMKAMKRAKRSKVDYHEINEAFSAVVLANMKILDLDPSRVNVHGGAVSLGHPLGMSGVRILMSLLNVLTTRDMSFGCSSICNGGGGATAMIIQRMNDYGDN